MNTNTTRRAMLAAVPAVAAAVAVPAVAIAAPADRRAWKAAVKAKEQALAAWDAYGPEYDRVHKAWLAARPSMEGIEWPAFFPEHHHPGGREQIARAIDLDERWRLFLEGEGNWWFSPNPDKRKAHFRAALDSVQAFRDAEAAHNRDSGMDAADAEYERLSEADSKALNRLMRMPAPDLAALRWKLDYVTENGGCWDAWDTSFVRQTLADIARLMPPAA